MPKTTSSSPSSTSSKRTRARSPARRGRRSQPRPVHGYVVFHPTNGQYVGSDTGVGLDGISAEIALHLDYRGAVRAALDETEGAKPRRPGIIIPVEIDPNNAIAD